jgi:hypothetical protein
LNWHSPPRRGSQGFDDFGVDDVGGMISGFGKRGLIRIGKGVWGWKRSGSDREARSLAFY